MMIREYVTQPLRPGPQHRRRRRRRVARSSSTRSPMATRASSTPVRRSSLPRRRHHRDDGWRLRRAQALLRTARRAGRWVEQVAVTGLATSSVCDDWDGEFGDNLQADLCPGAIPDADRYNAEDQPARRAMRPAGRPEEHPRHRPKTGAALSAARQRRRAVRPARAAQRPDHPDTVRRTEPGRRWRRPRRQLHASRARSWRRTKPDRIFRDSLVGEFGAINQTPIIDQTIPVSDDVPALDIHDQIRPYEIRARLDANYGSHASQAIWSGVPLPSSAILVAEQWLNALNELQARYPYKSRAWLVAHSRPAAPRTRAGSAAPVYPSAARCSMHSGPRQMAGGPLTEDDHQVPAAAAAA